MRAKELIEALDIYYPLLGLNDFEVKGISCNSKKVLSNFIFVAIKGADRDGHQFIREAIDKGAKAIIVHSPRSIVHSDKKVSIIRVDDTRKALAELAAKFYGNPSKKIKVVGITGTNGKTTVTYLIEAFLKEEGLAPAVIGTVNYRFNNRIIPAKNTTPGPIELQSLLASMAEENINYAIMEVSSHGLAQDRTWAISFHSAIFTNLTGDHLDYHKTKRNYFRAKAKLFENLSPHSFAVINNDDCFGRRLKDLTVARIITYGIKDRADIMAKEISFDIGVTEFLLKTIKSEIELKTRLIGCHNVYNILASCAWALKEGIKPATIKTALKKFCLVPGRLEKINCKRGFSVFVDYAHTDDALRNVIKSLRGVSRKRIIVVFGCGGERDKTKRSRMGCVASELADYAIITNDNPRSEEPERIIADIRKGIKKNNYSIIADRYEAIKRALTLAKTGDIVLIAGKGHEDYQILKYETIRFNDVEVVKECLTSMN